MFLLQSQVSLWYQTHVYVCVAPAEESLSANSCQDQCSGTQASHLTPSLAPYQPFNPPKLHYLHPCGLVRSSSSNTHTLKVTIQ